MTTIQWTDETWNPVTGCAKVSAGCKHCYAEVIAKRFWKDRKFTDVRCHPERLDQPLRWKKPRRIFVNSMSDLFHEDVPFEFIDSVVGRMLTARQHIYQILTKRPERMNEYFANYARVEIPFAEFAPNVWLGVSVENQETAAERTPILIQTPAAVRFLSVEPLLGPVNLNSLAPIMPPIHWVIVGGESGPGARPCNIEWIRDIVRQCRAAAVPVFVKQLGSMIIRAPMPHPSDAFLRVRDRKGGDPAEWPEDLRVRESPR